MVRIPRPHRCPTRHLMAATVILAIAGPLTLAGRPALASSLSCGATITTNTTLHADLNNCAGDGLVIGADNITLSLNGHTISGDATPGTDPDRPIAGSDSKVTTASPDRAWHRPDFDTNVGLDAASCNHIRGLTLLRAASRGIDAENGSDDNVIENNIPPTTAAPVSAWWTPTTTSFASTPRSTTSPTACSWAPARTTRSNTTFAADVGGDVELARRADNQITDNTTSGGSEEGVQIDGRRNLISGNRMARLTGDGIGINGDHNLIARNEIVTRCRPRMRWVRHRHRGRGRDGQVVVANRIARTGLEGIRMDSYPDETPPTIGTIVRANIVQSAGNDGIAVGTDPGSGG